MGSDINKNSLSCLNANSFVSEPSLFLLAVSVFPETALLSATIPRRPGRLMARLKMADERA